MTSERDVLTNAFIDREQLIKWNPEYIFLDMSSTAYSGKVLAEEWVSVLSAVKNKNIFTIYPYNWYTINYSTILVNSWFIGKVLFPEQFVDINPEIMAREIYKNILGRDVYDDMVAQFGTCRNIALKNE
jgi:iron complex transport system substrate-binding protein